jgi:hypothetical protein
MSLELLNTFATLGTFVVIAGTAIAAIVQLRHARSSNQIAAKRATVFCCAQAAGSDSLLS